DILQKFVGFHFDKLSAERVTTSSRKVRERHLVRFAWFRCELVYGTSESVRWEPRSQRGCVRKCAIQFFRGRLNHPIKGNAIWHKKKIYRLIPTRVAFRKRPFFLEVVYCSTQQRWRESRIIADAGCDRLKAICDFVEECKGSSGWAQQ